ncbi:probable starch synthase 4, chloroplastic/amyloplastic [Humulus lupulus]|uniref:probable starch synthase 4, chloroplastic/amyloplastic n=1 Tax=Humulus lupulus TaxID=3486 RepID=UPI002B4008AF|nr:probable starch synthase 4, chloroplastic/amyloplastic [Humulus lupulus]
MKALMITTTPAIQWQQWFPSSSKFNNPLQPLPVSPKYPSFSSCLRLEGHGNAEISESSNGETKKHADVWRLFKEAQQNILYLNKQRLKAMRELDRTNKEKQLLLDKIEQLELESQSVVAKDKLSFCWEMLLRIDSMVLTGMISTDEASDLRRLIMDHKESIVDVLTDTLQKKDVEFLAALRHFSDRRKKNGFYIVHICTEMAPLVSVGSLAFYITGLSRALQRKGHLVEVILPKYEILNLDEVQGLHEINVESYSYFNGQLHGNRIWTGVVCGIGVTLIEPQYYSSFFSRERVYGYPDDFERFSYFSRASLDYIVKSGKHPDVLHIHNWETAIIGPLFWDIFSNQGLGGTRILWTCHNLNISHLEHPDKLELCGLDPARLHRPDRLQDNDKMHLVNILKGGVVYSNKVIIMSSIQSKSKLISNENHGLESTLNIYKDKLALSPFGFDSSTWDPSQDTFLPENYSVDDMEGKTSCKVALQKYMGLSENESKIVVGCILSEGLDVDMENLKVIVRNAIGRRVQFIVMGNSTMPNTNTSRGLESLEDELKDKDIRIVLSYEEALSHVIFAGSDIILCQSFHDPIFQAPLKALKYGAAPISLASENYKFRFFVDHDFESTKFSRFISSTFGNMSLDEALNEIKNNQSNWKQNVMEGMAMDFSWDAECCDTHVSAYTALRNL